MAAPSVEVAGKCDGVSVWHLRKLEEGCPCGCDHSEAMAAELRDEGGEVAVDAIEATLEIIAEREGAGYITEAMVEHRLRLLDVRRDLVHASFGEPASRFGRVALVGSASPVMDNGRLRVRTELMAHGEATEVVRGHDKRVRASFRLGMEIQNTSGTRLTLEEPTLVGRVAFPVSRWYVLGGDGEPWDGVIDAGDEKWINVIGYLGEPVQPGTELEASVRFDSLVIPVSARARGHWNRDE